MNTYIETKTVNQLTIDTRITSGKDIHPVHITLKVANKKDATSWSLIFGNIEFDSVLAILERNNFKQKAQFLVHVQSDDETLIFAPTSKNYPRQVFPGILFLCGNHTLQRMKAFSTDILENGDLLITLSPSEFWVHTAQD